MPPTGLSFPSSVFRPPSTAGSLLTGFEFSQKNMQEVFSPMPFEARDIHQSDKEAAHGFRGPRPAAFYAACQLTAFRGEFASLFSKVIPIHTFFLREARKDSISAHKGGERFRDRFAGLAACILFHGLYLFPVIFDLFGRTYARFTENVRVSPDHFFNDQPADFQKAKISPLLVQIDEE